MSKVDVRKKILYIDMDNVLVDFASGVAKTNSKMLKRYEGHLDDIPHIFSKMDPMKGAIVSYRKLSKRFDTYILSTSPWDNPSAWHNKIEWVKKHLSEHAYKRLILTHHKNLNKGDYLIDDREKNGAAEFEGELILFGSKKFPNWRTVTNYLLSKN